MAESRVIIDEASDGTRIVRFDSTVYRLSSIKKAAYKFGGHFYVLIRGNQGTTEIELKPKESCSSPDALIGDFCNEVLDQELREIIAGETSGICDLLLAQAFSKTSLIDAESETEDYDSDPKAGTSGD